MSSRPELGWSDLVGFTVGLFGIEVCSYQATDLAVTSPVTAVTALSPDHLPWHGDTATYHRDKLSLPSQPGANLTVVSGTDAELRARAELLGPRRDWVVADEQPPSWIAFLGLTGRHRFRRTRPSSRAHR